MESEEREFHYDMEIASEQSKVFTAARLNQRQLLQLYHSCPAVIVLPRRQCVLTGLPATALH